VGQSLNFFPKPSVMAVIILARGSQSYPGVGPTLQGVFGVMEVRLSLLYPSCHIGSSRKLLKNRIFIFMY
jgi:hypothetical protein